MTGMKTLIVRKTFFYKGHSYIPGETIQCDDQEMIEAWERAGSVRAPDEQPQPKKLKARKASAEAGIPVEGEAEENLVGKVPGTEARKRK